MMAFCTANLSRSAQWLINVTKYRVARNYSNLLCNEDFTSKAPLSVQGFNYMYYPAHHFHCTHVRRLKTVFKKEQQMQILGFLNRLDPKYNSWMGKFRSLNKIAESLNERGHMTDIDDLMEKYSMAPSSAVKLCIAILESDDPQKENEKSKLKPKIVRLSRKMSLLLRAVQPASCDIKSIRSFTSTAIGENVISFTEFETKSDDWATQTVREWTAFDVSDDSEFCIQAILKIWKNAPKDAVYVIHESPAKCNGAKRHSRLTGATAAILCAKNNFSTDSVSTMFSMKPLAPFRHFNLLIGGECVSPGTIVSNTIDNYGTSRFNEHVFSRSLAEVTFEDEAKRKYQAYTDYFRESLCHSLLVGKTFIEFLQLK